MDTNQKAGSRLETVPVATPEPLWVKVLNGMMGGVALLILGVGIWVALDQNLQIGIRDIAGDSWRIVKYCLMAVPVLMAVVFLLTRRFCPKKIVAGIACMMQLGVFTPHKTQAQFFPPPPWVIRTCITLGSAVAGTALIVWRCDDPLEYLVCEVENGRPVPGTWRASPATVNTLLVNNEMRAQGPFKKNDPLGAKLRAAINNTNSGPTYMFDMSAIAKTPEKRLKLEIRQIFGTNATVVASQVVNDSQAFVLLPSWAVTNSFGEEQLSHIIPELNMPFGDILKESLAAGMVVIGCDQSSGSFRLGVELVVPCRISTESLPLEAGSTTGNDTMVYSGSTNTVTATPVTGCKFTCWSTLDEFGIPAVVSTEASYTFVAPMADVLLTANFQQNP